jgi:hypothetical protein
MPFFISAKRIIPRDKEIRQHRASARGMGRVRLASDIRDGFHEAHALFAALVRARRKREGLEVVHGFSLLHGV